MIVSLSNSSHCDVCISQNKKHFHSNVGFCMLANTSNRTDVLQSLAIDVDVISVIVGLSLPL